MELIMHGRALSTLSLNSYWAGDDGYHLQHTTQTSHTLMIPRVPVVTLSRPVPVS